MFTQRSGSVSKSRLNTVSICFLRLTTGFLLLTHYCRGQSHMVGPSKPILALMGEDVVLPCRLVPPANVASQTLEWARFDLNPRFVHVRRDGVELLIQQNPSYVGRTSLSTDKLKCGDISLKLSKVKLSDAGRYRCFIPALGSAEFNLTVGAVSSPVLIIAELDKSSSRVTLACSSAGWYPEPEVLWLDGEGNLLSAGPTETVRGPDDLYTVSSRVTVEKRHSNSFTCRVQQKDTSQMKETKIQILEDVFMAPSCFVRIAVVVSVCFLLSCVSAVFFLLWKRRQNKSQNKKHQSREPGETEQLVRGNKATKDSDGGTIQEKMEDHEDIVYMISALNEQKKELETSKEKHISELKQLEEELRQLEKEFKKKFGFHWDKETTEKNFSMNKKFLEDTKTHHQTSLQSVEKHLHRINEMITRLTKGRRTNQMEQKRKHLEEKTRRTERDEAQSEQLETERETETNSEPPMDQSPQPEDHQSQKKKKLSAKLPKFLKK